ncbi:MAG: hypothetical protein A3J29_07095 [Acidobacteria bacterium RIFCSPLOWO2_12_FULL_67_14b]|nr:MAG: hypothetical protein A3J29_07095 [Acidobacteria bacterium RIFCSPLOWO2_12_FULL_67_14b]
MHCPLCHKRPTKRACPALRQDICATCCATKRLVEISCPADCTYLQSGQKHPAAVVKRQIDRDVTALMATLGRVSEEQLQLFFLLQSIILGYKPDGLARLVDSDVALATGALASSLETASRGVIYEESTSSMPAESLRRELKGLIEEVTKHGGARAEREVAVVLRGIERGARHEGSELPDGPTSYLELAGRILRQQPPAPAQPGRIIGV